MMSFFLWAAAGFWLGILSSLHCLGMCGPIAFFIGSGRSGRRGFFQKTGPFLWITAGKALTYGCIGLTFGWAGYFLTRWDPWTRFSRDLPLASGLLMIAAGLYAAGYFPALRKRFHAAEAKLGGLLQGLRAVENPGAFFAAGMLWGFLPCPMVLLPALGAVFSGGSGGATGALRGFFMMLGFGIGTAPAIVAGGLGGSLLLQNLRRRLRPAWTGLGMAGLGAALVIFSMMHSAAGHCH